MSTFRQRLDKIEGKLSSNNLNCYKKNRIYKHPHDNTLIELHWRFINEQPFLLVDFSDLFEQSQSLSFHQQNIKLLGYQHLWLYQVLHGTCTGWYRLHWLSDIAKYADSEPTRLRGFTGKRQTLSLQALSR